MTFELPTSLAISFVLAVVRASAWLVIAPPFNTRVLPTQVKIGLAVALALPVAPRLVEYAPPPEVGPLIVATLLQVAAGLALGFLVLLLFSAVQAAGQLIDLFVGFTIAATYNPLSGVTEAVIGRFYHLVALTLLFALDGHLLLVHGFLDSFAAMPSGVPDLASLSEVLIHDLGLFFFAALEIAAPLLGALFLTEVTLGLLSRAAPQLNVFMLGFPAKILLALVLVGLAVPLLPNAIDALVHDIVRSTVTLTGVGSA